MEPMEQEKKPAGKPTRSGRRSNEQVLNLLTVLVLITTIGLVALFVGIFLNPTMPLNPFPPPTVVPTIVLPTASPTERVLPPTWTPTDTLEPTATETPTLTPTFQIQLISETPVIQTTPTRANSSYPFVVQTAPAAISSSIYHAENGCNWLGVAGNVVDLQGSPVLGLQVRLGGYFNGSTKNLTTLTGLARSFGESGYEFNLADTPIASSQQLWIRLYDQSDIPVSEKIYFDTFADCENNLILINFKQVR